MKHLLVLLVLLRCLFTIHVAGFSCSRDECQSGVHYCVTEQQRCHLCKARIEECDAPSLPTDCTSFCELVSMKTRIIQLNNTNIDQKKIIADLKQQLRVANATRAELEKESSDWRSAVIAIACVCVAVAIACPVIIWWWRNPIRRKPYSVILTREKEKVAFDNGDEGDSPHSGAEMGSTQTSSSVNVHAETGRISSSGHTSVANESQRPGVNDSQRHTANDFQRPVANDFQRPVTNDFQRPVVNDLQRYVANDLQQLGSNDSHRTVANDFQRPMATDSQLHVANDSQSHVTNASQRHMTNDSQRHMANDSQLHMANDSQSHVTNDSQRHMANDSQRLVARSRENTESMQCSNLEQQQHPPTRDCCAGHCKELRGIAPTS